MQLTVTHIPREGRTKKGKRDVSGSTGKMLINEVYGWMVMLCRYRFPDLVSSILTKNTQEVLFGAIYAGVFAPKSSEKE